MQNDLISRSALIEAIVNRTGSPTVLFNTTEELNAYLEGCAYKQNAIIDMINDLPTAYDVEKVVDKTHQVFVDELNLVLKDIPEGAEYTEEAYRLLYLNKCVSDAVRNGGKE